MRKSIFCILFFLVACHKAKKYDTSKAEHEIIDLEVEKAQTLINLGKLNSGIKILEDLYVYFPDSSKVLKNFAFAYESSDKLFFSAKIFENLSHLNNECREYALYAAQNYKKLRYFISAARCYRYYLEHFINDKIAWKELYSVELKLKNYHSAIQAYLNSIKDEKEELNLNSALVLAKIFLKLKNFDQAKIWFIHAKNLQPLNKVIHIGLLKCAHEQKNFTEAQKELNLLRNKNVKFSKPLLAVEREVNKFFEEKFLLESDKINNKQLNTKTNLFDSSALKRNSALHFSNLKFFWLNISSNSFIGQKKY